MTDAHLPHHQTTDLQIVLERVLDGGTLTKQELIMRALAEHPQLQMEDPRWFEVALLHLIRDHRIEYAQCEAGHQHAGTCLITWRG